MSYENNRNGKKQFVENELNDLFKAIYSNITDIKYELDYKDISEAVIVHLNDVSCDSLVAVLDDVWNKIKEFL